LAGHHEKAVAEVEEGSLGAMDKAQGIVVVADLSHTSEPETDLSHTSEPVTDWCRTAQGLDKALCHTHPEEHISREE